MARLIRSLPPLLIVVLFSLLLSAEDVKLREEAVRLMERANAVSLMGSVATYEQVVSFRVYELDGSVKQGAFRRVSAGAAGDREEETLGDYHAVSVRSGNRVSSTRSWTPPPEFRELGQQIPVHLGRFDHEDVIRSVEDATVSGRPAKCIQFDTRFGNAFQSNQICVDRARGALLRWQVGDELIENSEYFRLGDLWEPAHIQRTVNGALRMEIDQKLTLLQEPMDPNLLTPPTSQWNTIYQCRTMRRAVAISTPQPQPGTAGENIVDVIVHGYIRETGRTEGLQVQSSPRPDLNAEALETVAKWTFQPMMCNDAPATWDATFVVHFQGR